MKNLVKYLLAGSAGVMMTMSVNAQTGVASHSKYGHGADSIDCVRALSIYGQDYKNKDYAAAIVNWRFVFANCPESTKNNAPRGIAMYQYFIERELDPKRKSELVDTLMMCYRLGIRLIPNKKADYQKTMALDMEKYLDKTPENRKKILAVLEEGIVSDKATTLPSTYDTYMQMAINMNKDNAMSDEDLLDTYNKVNEWMGEAIKASKSDSTKNEEYAKARNRIDELFARSPAASCANLDKIYTPKFESSKNDLAFLRKLMNLLNRNECTDIKLYEMASEQMFALEPSASAAYNMAQMFYKRDNYEKAIEYYDKAIAQETENVEKANYLCRKASLLLKMKKYVDAKKCVLDAIKLRPNWGEPYLILANIYYDGSRCGEDKFEQNQIYWIIVDKLTKAKTVDPDYAEKVNGTIRSYSAHFPNKEEAFFRGITAGSTVTVGCWINESTKARW